MRYIKAAVLLIAVILAAGCIPKVSPQADLDRYYVFSPKNLKTFAKNNNKYYVYDTPEYKLTFALLGYQEFLIVQLTINNKTDQDFEPSAYSLALYDGRDSLPIKMITRDSLTAIQKKIFDSNGGFNLASPSIQGAMGTVDSLLSLPANSALGNDLKTVISKYFAFRPVYAKSTRSGFIGFFHDFKLEYPITFSMAINGKNHHFFFAPNGK